MSDGAEGDGGLEEVRRADEVLQVMFWMRGEGLGEEVSPGDLDVFLGREVDGEDVRAVLEGLAERGLVASVDAGQFRLTEQGLLAGGRRFADEFADLTGQAHGECDDPDCGCHEDPEAAIECHRERQGASSPGGGS